METEGMDYNTSKFEEGMGILSDVFCSVPNNFFLSALSTNNLLFFFILAKQIKMTATTLQDSDGFLLVP